MENQNEINKDLKADVLSKSYEHCIEGLLEKAFAGLSNKEVRCNNKKKS